MAKRQSGRIERILKRVMDLLLATFALITLSPVLLVVGLLVRYFHGSPVLFSQLRPGQFGRAIRLYKYRTMNDQRDVDGNLLPDHQRLTAFGAFLRKTSIDELPELFNVIRGEMSLVGPRPLLMEYLPFYTTEEMRRHDVKPGITGWAQINGRNYLPWDKRLGLDVWYVDNWSLLLDIHIIGATIVKVLRREGVAVDPDTAETNLHEERLAAGWLPTARPGVAPYVMPAGSPDFPWRDQCSMSMKR